MATTSELQPRIEVKREADLTPAERAAVAEWTDAVFGQIKHTLAPIEWRVMLWLGGELVSHVAVIRRTVVAAGQPVDVGGIGYVGTVKERRTGGLASQTMRRAQDLLAELAVDFGLLVTSQRTAPFYEKLGWSIVPGPTTFDQPTGPMTWPGVLMALPVRRRDWPGGPVDLGGLLW